ncbi:MAG: aldo/keto reductase [Pseudomonadota bacterium]
MLKKRRLGRTEMMVSELGFGGIPIIPLPEPEAVGVVRHCFDRGINFFDTANMYADSEIKIGKALADARSDIYLATKTTERSLAGANAHLELSLKQLGVDHIDLYQLHNLMKPEEIKEAFGPGGVYPAVEKARREGRVKHIGFSSHDLNAAIELCRTGKFSTVQIPFNFIEREPADELFAAAKENDMGVIAMKPIGGGLLDRVDLCFKFLRQHPEALPIPGFSSIAEADEVIDFYLNPQPMTAEDEAALVELREIIGKKFCHRCAYCLPCPQDVNIPGAFLFPSVVARFDPAMTVAFTGRAVESARECIECEDCVSRCPYSLNIPEMLKETVEKYDRFLMEHHLASPGA